MSALADAMLIKLLAAGTLEGASGVAQEVRSMIVATPVEGMVTALQAMRDRPDSTPVLPAITVPTLVIAGEEDAITPAVGMRSMADSIPGSTYVCIPGAGHLSPVEQPGRVGGAVSDWLRGLAS